MSLLLRIYPGDAWGFLAANVLAKVTAVIRVRTRVSGVFDLTSRLFKTLDPFTVSQSRK